MNEPVLGAAAAICTAIGMIAGKVLSVRGERRRHSGTVDTSDASEIFDAGSKLIDHMHQEIARLDRRIDDLVKDNNELRDANASLVVSNHALIEKVDELSADNRGLIEENHKLSTLVEELLERLGHKTTAKQGGTA